MQEDDAQKDESDITRFNPRLAQIQWSLRNLEILVTHNQWVLSAS